jgi:glyoxylase-like metal-dependent hydrolase (beta-lactamase superfamily II)
LPIEQIDTGFSNFSYVIYCKTTKKAALVDPSYKAEKALKFINSNGLTLEYIINTHHHSDHTGDNLNVKKQTGAKIIASVEDGRHINGVDQTVSNNEEILLGEMKLKFLLTPGHTPGGICIIVDNEVIITGDTLFIGDCGRCDLPGGDFKQMFTTLQNKIKTLPDHLIVYPGHNYGDKPFDTLGNQKKTNKTLVVNTLEEFSKIP